MTVTHNIREGSQRLTEQLMTDRIRILASQGLKLRDISSLLNVHPLSYSACWPTTQTTTRRTHEKEQFRLGTAIP